ncbi:pectinesterase family protein [Pseudoduganella sp. S-14]|uniref:pectinesterase family protein n=1 Tax=Pseudoduganella sp. S-14 TaxID=3404065 RepID=UPI003CE97248
MLLRCLLLACVLLLSAAAQADPVEQWGTAEIELAGPRDGNPFLDVQLAATFRQGGRSVPVAGFYDGDGSYKVRFMPDSVGTWQYETRSNRDALSGKTGKIQVVAPKPGNRGPVRVHNTWHFVYADGTPFWQVGTTSYSWTNQPAALQEQTLRTLATAPFNKLRMGVFPKRYEFNRNEPPLYPFEGKAPSQWDFSRFNPAFFRNFEQRVGQLRDLGIEADIILFHPYDKGHWGFDAMAQEANERYLRYIVARLAAYRNVWWSMANEFDFIKSKSMADWDRYFQLVQASDPYQHLRSIHNAFEFYNHNKPWVTHVSVQSGSLATDFERAVLLRDVYNKPVVYDEVKYEGNFPQRWGNLTPQEMVLRFWEGAIAGTYVGHSETYTSPDEVVWWAKGGVLHGQSPARLEFFRKILAESPAQGLEPIDKWQGFPFAGRQGQYYLGYFGREAPVSWPVVLHNKGLAEGTTLRAEVIDTWNMTVTPVPGVFEMRKRDAYNFADKDGRSIALPGRPYMAVRLVRVGEGAACAGGAAWCRGEPWLVPPAAPTAAVALVPAAETAAAAGASYYVEARLRPAPGSAATDANRSGYVIVRYADDRNWLGFGLEAAPGGTMAVNILRMIDGQPKFLKQVRIEPDAGEAFYTIRLDVDGAALTAYLNGTRLIGVDEANSLPPRIGVLAQGGQFEIDGLRAGSMAQPPTSIGLAHQHKQLALQAGDPAQRFTVRAASRGGLRALRFAASSSDASVLDASVDGDELVLAPRRAGFAAVTLASAEDPNVAATLAVRVGAAFAASSRSGALATGSVSPVAGERDVPVDTRLQLRFDQAPALGDSGSVRIVRAKDNVTVDVIRPGLELDEIGASRDGVKRVVRYKAITLDGATATIRPHDGKLAYGTDYYVLVDGKVFTGAALAKVPFEGIAKPAGWTFRTRDRAPQDTALRVAPAGKADFRTVQGALDHAMQNIPRATPVTISLANGKHDGLLYLRGKDNVTLRGDSRHDAIIAGENSDGVNPGSGNGQLPLAPGAGGGRSVFLVEDADLLRLDRLTLVNTTWRSKTIGAQAEALNFNSEGRLVANEADFLSEQDTIQVKGYAWFYRSLVAGNVDFVWGYNRAALFEESEIRSVGDSANPSSGGYLVQARTVAEDDPGFVFLNSRLTHGPGPAGNDVPPAATFLARPGVATAWDNVRFINCSVGPHVNAAGWYGKPRAGKGWEEGGSTDLAGRPLDLSQRAAVRVLAPADAARYDSRAKVFAQYANGKGWNPQP